MAVAKQWEQTFVKGIVSSLRDKQNSITESSIYNKQSIRKGLFVAYQDHLNKEEN